MLSEAAVVWELRRGGMDQSSRNFLKGIVREIEALEEEKREISRMINHFYQQAKELGFDPKVVRRVIRWRAMPPSERAEMEDLFALYMSMLESDNGA